MFERIYLCLETCKEGFAKTCRPLIRLGACFLKEDYDGQLMAAVGRDGNNQKKSTCICCSWSWNKGFMTMVFRPSYAWFGRIQSEVLCIYIRSAKGIKHLYLYLCIYLFTCYAFRCLHIIHILHVTRTSFNCSRHQCQCGVQIMCEAFIWHLE